MPNRRILATMLLAVAVFSGSALAQPASNSLAPGIAPYTPKAIPDPAASKDGAMPDPQNAKASGASPARSGGATSGPPVPAGDTAPYDYVLGTGDKLRIIVFGEDNLTGEFVVAGNGGISLPLIGEVQAAGKTVRALQDLIEVALKDGYLKDPRVSAEILTFRPYYILGEVAKPGEYPYRNRMTVMDAIATAGGFTYRANHKYIYVKKANEAVEHKVRLTDEVQLDPGDTARIGERYF